MPEKRGSETNPLFFKSPEEFRKWLEKNHDKADELWMGFWKKGTGKPSLTWQETVEEVLCFGWIDGVRKSIDADCYKQRVTPRRARSIWSNINIGHVERLQREGRMRPPGLAAFEKRTKSGVYSFEQTGYIGLGTKEEAVVRKNRKAWEFLQAQPPGYRKLAGWFVMSAKKEETRLRRLERLVSDCVAGRRLGPITSKKK